MGKATKAKRNSVRASAARPEHPLIVQADITPEQRRRAAYEVAQVPNPYGEVVVRDEVVRHKAVRRVPQFETLYRLGVFDKAEPSARAVLVALEWYADQQDLAGSGLYKCGLDVSTGGSSHSHTPAGHAAVAARSNIKWARGFIAPELLPAFDAVMVDGEAFIETARRMHAKRYVRVSVRRARQLLRDQFVQAAEALAAGIDPYIIA